MQGDSPDIAGGQVSGTLANNTFENNVFGCTAKRTATGNVQVTLPKAIPLDKQRIWIANATANPLFLYDLTTRTETGFIVQTYQLGVAAGPALSETPTNLEFAFGVSIIPE